MIADLKKKALLLKRKGLFFIPQRLLHVFPCRLVGAMSINII